ncbi:MAG TPA: MFS transporter [Actinomycetota bacterium]|nr:MFS transporter [Actinomycetota bacterium]
MRQRAGPALGFATATVGYLAVTTGESLLAPLLPLLREELGLDLRGAGLALGLVSAAIAVGNLGGGALLARRGTRQGTVAGLAVAAAGGLVAATSQGPPSFLLGQALLGLGSGVFFAAGLRAVGVLGGSRRGLAMGVFGVAFSGGLALAALLAALAGVWGWRTSFVAVAVLALATALAAAVAPLPGAPAPTTAGDASGPGEVLRRLLASPLLVGGVAAASQYGTVAFLPSFAVTAWGLSPATAALLLAAARLLSVPAKLVSGNAADQAGSYRIARRLGLLLAMLGACWTLLPAPVAPLAAVAFAAFVSGLGPVANVLAFERYGGSGMLLGAFRSAQIGLAAAAGAGIGAASAAFGLRPVLAVSALLPLLLLPLGRRRPLTP